MSGKLSKSKKGKNTQKGKNREKNGKSWKNREKKLKVEIFQKNRETEDFEARTEEYQYQKIFQELF